MKKRLKKKLAKKEKMMDNACSDCGSQLIIKNVAIDYDKNLGNFIIYYKHRVCPRCGSAYYHIDMYNILLKLKKERIHELLLKNYPIESNEYISEDEMCKLESCNKEELKEKFFDNRWVYYLDIDGKRYYLKRSYDIFKKTNRPGFFDLTYHHK